MRIDLGATVGLRGRDSRLTRRGFRDFDTATTARCLQPLKSEPCFTSSPNFDKRRLCG